MNLFVARKNLLLLKIKNSTILIIFEMISFKSIKLLGNFIDWRRIYARILFETAMIYLILVDHLPNTMKEFKNLKHRNELTKLVLLMMQHIMIKIQLRELFQIRFQKIELVKLLEVINMMDIKEHQQVWSISSLIQVYARFKGNI